MISVEDAADAEFSEAETYEVLRAEDVNSDPPIVRPIGPGDVFGEVSLDHLATPMRGPVIVVGHPCSLRRGLLLQENIPVAPIAEPGIPSDQHPIAERVLPVKKLLPPGSGHEPRDSAHARNYRPVREPLRAVGAAHRSTALGSSHFSSGSLAINRGSKYLRGSSPSIAAAL